jgi:hypothetical protein
VKKIFILVIVFFSGINHVFAGDDFLVCSHEIPNFSTHDLCQKSQAVELLTGVNDRGDSAFETELKKFKEKSLNQVHLDNKSNATFIANKIVFELRQHQECLQDICQKVFDQCGNSTEQDFNQKQWCDDKVEQLMELQKTEIHATATNTQARKERSLLKQKLVAIEVRSQKYFIELLTTFTKDLKRFEGKVSKFIKFPK